MKVSINIAARSEMTFSAQHLYSEESIYGVVVGTNYTFEAVGPIGRRAIAAAAAKIFDEATEEERRIILAPKAVNLRVEVHGYAIERNIAGEWTMRAPASDYGYETDAEMLEADGFLPEVQRLKDAGYAHAPSMGKILQALCERIEAMGMSR